MRLGRFITYTSLAHPGKCESSAALARQIKEHCRENMAAVCARLCVCKLKWER